MGILRERNIDNIEGKEVYVYTLINNNNVTVRVTNYGGIILSILMPDKNGKIDDIVLGYENFDDYKTTTAYLGALVGRCANRIAKGSMEIDGVKYDLVINNGKNHLHGGNKNFSKVVWDSEIVEDNNGQYLKLSYFSEDLEENYPGNLNVIVNYKLNEDNELLVEYYAKSDKDTVVNLTNHSYFNLDGHASGNILKHKVKIYAKNITEANEESIPTGVIRSIVKTPLDFTEFKEVGKDINAEYDQLIFANGYDHNWILDDYTGEIKIAAEVISDNSGRKLEVYTTKPGVQFYTGNFLNENEIGKGGVKYNARQGLCLETQYFPDSINHNNFPSVLLKAGEMYKHKTIYKLEVIN